MIYSPFDVYFAVAMELYGKLPRSFALQALVQARVVLHDLTSSCAQANGLSWSSTSYKAL